MSKSPLRRASLAGLATAAMVVSLSGYGVTAASADSSFRFDRVVDSQHMNRFGTSVAAAKLFGTSDSVILANGEKGHYPDALTASYLSQDQNAPVLLTKLATTPDVVTQYLDDTNVQNITIVGGPEAVSTGQATALTNAGYTVNRIQGTGDDTTRYGTARAVSEAVGGTHDTAVLATGESFPDAVAAGPLSYARDLPLAITKTNTVPQATLDALKAANVTNVVVVGGPNAISDAVIAQLNANGITVKYRADGLTRSETSTKLATIEMDHYGFTETRVNVASGKDNLNGADALSAGPVSGKENRPTLITASNGSIGSGALPGYLSDHSDTLSGTDNHIFGGPEAVSQAVQDALEAAAQSSNGQITLTSSSVQQGGALTGTITGDNISSVSVTGCGLDNQTVGPDDNSTTAGRQFTLNLPSSQQPASCTLVFTITNTDGTTTTESRVITVTAPSTAASLTAGPELRSVAITQTSNPADPANGVVTYTFDSAVDGRAANPADFHLYRFDGKDFNAQSLRVSGNQVIASFDASQLQNITLGTVDTNAVEDVSGQQNPEGAEPVQAVIQSAGVTTAPDLVSVGNFRTNLAGDLFVDYGFDQAVGSIRGIGGVGNDSTPDATRFQLIEQDGSADKGQTATVTGTDSRTVTVKFTSGTVNVPQSQVSRGVVLQKTVGDGAQVFAGRAAGGNTNPLEAADVSNSGNTDEPDLVSARVTGTNTVEYTFDEAVSANTANQDALQFYVYNADAVEQNAAGLDRSQTNAKVITATFANASDVRNAVGANVRARGVKASDNENQPGVGFNEPDEVSLQQVGFQAGRTTLPDLTAVKVITNPVTQNKFVRYTFDQAVTAATFQARDFHLYDAANFRFSTTGAGAVTAVAGDANSVDVAGFSTSQINAAVLGTVNDTSADAAGGVPQTQPRFPEYDAPVTQ